MPYHLVAFLVAALVVPLDHAPLSKSLGSKVAMWTCPILARSHKHPMVRLGGISIFFGNLIALLIVWISGGFRLSATRPLSMRSGASPWGACYFSSLVCWMICLPCHPGPDC